MNRILPNGAKILTIDFEGGFILAHNKGAVQPYVVWDYFDGDLASTTNGAYCRNLKEARKVFAARVEAFEFYSTHVSVVSVGG